MELRKRMKQITNFTDEELKSELERRTKNKTIIIPELHQIGNNLVEVGLAQEFQGSSRKYT